MYMYLIVHLFTLPSCCFYGVLGHISITFKSFNQLRIVPNNLEVSFTVLFTLYLSLNTEYFSLA